MFEIDPSLLAAWAAQQGNTPEQGGPPETLSSGEIAELEAVYGQKMPADYVRFMATYGAVQFPLDAPRNFQYLYEDGAKKQYFEGHIHGFFDFESMMRIFVAMIEDPDNDEEEPFFPRNYLPFASNMDQDTLLIELGTETPRIWYWEDNPYAWGHGTNTRLGYIAPDLKAFVENLA